MPPAATDFGPYRLLSPIGRGGMGVTWKAVRKDAGSSAVPVVIKRILPDLAADPALIEAFVDEAHVTASLTHPNIAQVLDFGRVEGEYYFAIEFVHGRTLQNLTAVAAANGLPALPVPIACLVAQGMLAALQYAHTRAGPDGAPLRIVHRDISPDNVLIGFDGLPRVIDFGVAKAKLRGRRDTMHGLVKGKWTYFSPEQAASEQLDGRSDLFAVGVTLYRMLCGRLPFAGTQWEALQHMVKGEYPQVAALNPGLPESLVGAVGRALEVNREKRFQSAALMSRALGTVLAEVDPQAGQQTLKSFMHWAFAAELENEGLTPEVSKHDRAQIDRWVRKAFVSGDVEAISSAQNEAPATFAATRAARKGGRRRLPLAVALLALTGLGAGAVTAVALVPRAPAPPSAQRAQAFELLERQYQTLLAEDPRAAQLWEARVASLRTQLTQVDAVDDAAFRSACEAVEGELVPQLRRLREAREAALEAELAARPVVELPTRPRLPQTIDRTSIDPKHLRLRLSNPRHNLSAHLQPPPAPGVRRVEPGGFMSMSGHIAKGWPSFPMLVVTREDGIARLERPAPRNAEKIIQDEGSLLRQISRMRESRYLPDPGVNAQPIEFGILTGPADVRLVNFLPFADETTERVAKTSFERAVGGVELLTSEHVNALVVEGMDRFISFEVKVLTRLAPTAPAVLMNCGDRSQVLFPPGGPVPPQDSPVHCAFALLGPSEPRTIELELVGKLKAFRNPKLPPFDSNFEWNPLEPRPADLKPVTAGNVTRLFSGTKTALKGGDWSAATGTAQVCVRELPTSAECHLLYGYACSNLGDRACAEKHYREFLKLAPAHAVAAEVQRVLSESPARRAKR